MQAHKQPRAAARLDAKTDHGLDARLRPARSRFSHAISARRGSDAAADFANRRNRGTDGAPRAGAKSITGHIHARATALMRRLENSNSDLIHAMNWRAHYPVSHTCTPEQSGFSLQSPCQLRQLDFRCLPIQAASRRIDSMSQIGQSALHARTSEAAMRPRDEWRFHRL